MAKGNTGYKLHPNDQFRVVNDEKLRLSMIALADRYDQKVQNIIEKTYNDMELHSLYRAMRNSGVFDHGGKSKVHREIVRFPNAYVFDFVDTILSTLYGGDWITNTKALNHELVRPWWVISKL